MHVLSLTSLSSAGWLGLKLTWDDQCCICGRHYHLALWSVTISLARYVSYQSMISDPILGSLLMSDICRSTTNMATIGLGLPKSWQNCTSSAWYISRLHSPTKTTEGKPPWFLMVIPDLCLAVQSSEVSLEILMPAQESLARLTPIIYIILLRRLHSLSIVSSLTMTAMQVCHARQSLKCTNNESMTASAQPRGAWFR